MLSMSLCVALSLISHKADNDGIQLCLQHEEYITNESKKYDLDPAIIVSLIDNESSWNSSARSDADACGLMQVVPKWSFVATTCEEQYFPEKSIAAGIQILNQHIKKVSHLRYKIRIKTTLCMYNEGPKCRMRGSRNSYKYSRTIMHKAHKIKNCILNKKCGKKMVKSGDLVRVYAFRSFEGLNTLSYIVFAEGLLVDVVDIITAGHSRDVRLYPRYNILTSFGTMVGLYCLNGSEIPTLYCDVYKTLLLPNSVVNEQYLVEQNKDRISLCHHTQNQEFKI